MMDTILILFLIHNYSYFSLLNYFHNTVSSMLTAGQLILMKFNYVKFYFMSWLLKYFLNAYYETTLKTVEHFNIIHLFVFNMLDIICADSTILTTLKQEKTVDMICMIYYSS